MTPLLSPALTLAVTYAVLGASVAVVLAATRRLHLALGQILVAGVLLAAVASSPSTGWPVWSGPAVAVVLGALLSAALGPLLLDRSTDPLLVLVGLVVVAGTIDAALARGLTAATFRPDPLLRLPGVAGLDPAVTTAVLVGLPLVLGLAGALTSTRWGRRVRIIGGSPAAAVRLGLAGTRLRAEALAVAGAATVVAGLLAAPLATVGTGQAAGFTVRGVAAAALLGRGGPLWAVAGGAVLAVAEVVGTSAWPAAGGDVAVGVVVIAGLWLRGSSRSRGWERAW